MVELDELSASVLIAHGSDSGMDAAITATTEAQIVVPASPSSDPPWHQLREVSLVR